MISFRKITKNNYKDVIELDAGEEGHKHVARNNKTILEAIFEHSLDNVKAIYNNRILVGCVFYYRFFNTVWIGRLMLDKKYQNKGLGSKIIVLLLEKIKKQENPDKIEFLTSNPIVMDKISILGFKKVNNQRSKNYYKKYKEHLYVLNLK